MAKTHRGRGIRELASHGRGTCPRCGATNIKVLYEKEIDGKQQKICKFCNAALSNVAKKEARATKSVAKEQETPAKENATA